MLVFIQGAESGAHWYPVHFLPLLF